GDHVLRFRTNWTAPVTDPCATYSYGNCCDFKANTGEGGPTTDWLWIDEADLTFTLPANGGTKVVPVHFDSEGLASGDYMGAINVSSNDPINPMIEVPATLHVLPGTGELVVNPTSLTETHYVPPAQTTTQVLELTNNTGGPVAWTLAIDAGVDAGFLNIVPEVSAETPVYTGQMEVEREPGITPGEMVEGPANYASFFGTRGELYNNGGFVTAEGVGTNGTDYSELQDASLTMGTYGSGCQISAGNSIADDFVVPANWSVESFTFFAYQTGSGTTSTLNAVHVQIYDGDPSAGGTVIYGDMTTNVMESTSWTNAWRVLESAPSENRPIMQIVASTPDLSLAPGTYWVEMSIGGTGASGPWAPPITVVGQTTTGNSIQKTTTGWAPLIDVGPQGLPFIITGTGEVAPWLTASPVSGTINNGQTIPINVTFNSEGLDPDTYTGSITISSNQPDLVVPVTFIVEVESPYLPPQNLTAEVQDWYNVFLEWDPPASGSFDPEWITYSSDVITNSIGTNAAANFDVAARFTPDMLGDFEGGMLTKIDFVPGEPSSLSTYTLKVWQGGNNNPTLVYSQPVTTIVADQWNTVTLTTPVEIDVNQELWFGFNCNATGGFPAGCDDGPQVEGFGNMMFWNGAWTTLSQLGATLTFDWAVKGYVEAGGMQVESYNIYRETLDPTEYDLVGNTDELFYLDEELGVDCFKYYVTAVYGPDMESGPSNIVEEICTSISDPSGASSSLQIYPNPAKDQFTIKSETELQSVIMVNYSGQVVMNRKATGNELLINANDFAKGVYTLQVETKDGRSVHKVVIQ
ncbi:MAG: T9SS type A sorting domain-containing protein, partial [Clostridia bacterium]|nr:T9SS type A sorting domain-containing protein [Clostridia bacterium]